MSRPKLPSQLHADYPKATHWIEDGRHYYKTAPAEDFIKFYQSHPEFKDEGDFECVCPFCGDPTETEPGRLCCGEVRAEWVYVNNEGEVCEPPEGTKYYD